ncbi:MAG: BsaWI family type II restriction enzyme [Thermoplasmata archaeon]
MNAPIGLTDNTFKDEVMKARQSAVSKAGNDWENYVENFLRESLKEIESKFKEYKTYIEDINIQRMGKKSEIESIKKNYPLLYQSLFIPIINFGKDRELLLKNTEIIDEIFSTGVVGDTDIVIFSKNYQIPVLIVSCKVSLHGRLTESLFYSLYYKITNKIKFVLATPDKGKQAKEKWETEWGMPEKPSKDRMLATLFLDGIYVDNVPNFMPPSFNPERDKTALGGIVRPLVELPYDIIRWYEDIKFMKNNGKNG